jgi:uncharacterized membrane protein YfcA
MKLDDLKQNWRELQEKELGQNKHTIETINKIIMNTTNTLTEMQQKNASWKSAAKAFLPALVAVLIVEAIISYIKPDKTRSFGEMLAYTAILIFFSIVSLWMYNRQDQLFRIYNTGNLRESLSNTIKAFNNYYKLYNAVYIFLIPAYFYSMFKLFFGFLSLSTNGLVMICGVLTAAYFLISYVYYKLTFFRKIKTLKRDLVELENV